jgi:endonuclease/exonuclease/phosphatase family metal-dependent hydrolase
VTAVAEAISPARPDVVFLQESGLGAVSNLDADLAFRIAEELGGLSTVSATTMALRPERVCGLTILSRYELCDVKAHSSTPAHPVHAISARLKAHGRPLTLVNILMQATYQLSLSHARDSFSNRWNQTCRMAEFVAGLDGDVIVAGDLNAMPWMPEYAHLSRDLTDFADEVCPDAVSFPADRPLIRLDYVFGRGEFRSDKYEVLNACASDHRPVAVVLTRGPDSSGQVRQAGSALGHDPIQH